MIPRYKKKKKDEREDKIIEVKSHTSGKERHKNLNVK